MSDLICITNRTLCRGDFLSQIENIAKSSPKAIILREKDLSPNEYKTLAEKVTEICKRYNTSCILHNYINVAVQLNTAAIHLPMSALRTMSDMERRRFSVLGASCHSVEEGREAEKLGCSYITAGHIFATDCKKNVPPRGIEFLKDMCSNISISVYAVGGITPVNASLIKSAGATGYCVMSGLMQCDNVQNYINKFEKSGEANAT